VKGIVIFYKVVVITNLPYILIWETVMYNRNNHKKLGTLDGLPLLYFTDFLVISSAI
jgi:hypothetical protein